jgi:hypothetical protein
MSHNRQQNKRESFINHFIQNKYLVNCLSFYLKSMVCKVILIDKKIINYLTVAKLLIITIFYDQLLYTEYALNIV